MAYARLAYLNVNGSTNQFDVTFPYISKTHVIVKVDGTATTNFTWLTSSRIQLTATPASGSNVIITRETSPTTRLVDYQTGSILSESVLDTDSLQAFYLGQEAQDVKEYSLTKSDADNLWDAETNKIKNVTDPTAAQDAATKNYVDTAGDSKVAQAAASATSAAASAVTAGQNAGTQYVDTFNGTGSQTAFTLSATPTTENNTLVTISGVVQHKSSYSLSGSTLTFSSAPAAGTGNIEVVHLSLVPLAERTLASALSNGNTTGGNDIAVGANDDITLVDGATIKWGTSGDGLSVYHNGNHSYITETGTGTGNTYLLASNLILGNQGSSKNYAQFTDGGAAVLYENGAQRFETTSTGAAVTGALSVSTNLTVTGNLEIDGTTNLDAVDIDGSVQIDGAVSVGVDDQGYDVTLHGDTSGRSVTWDSSDNALEFSDNSKAIFGNGSDFAIYHDAGAGHTYMTEQGDGTGNLFILASDMVLGDHGGAHTYFSAVADGASKLFFDNSEKIATASSGINVSGEVAAVSLDISGDADIDGTTNLDAVDIDGAVQIDSTVTVGVDDAGHDVKFFGDTSGRSVTWDTSDDALEFTANTKAKFNDAFEIYHDGSNTRLHDTGTGNLLIQSNGAGIYLQKDASESLASFGVDGAVTLFNNDSPKFETTATGVSVSGGISATGNLTLDSDAAAINFGDDQEITLTHVHNAGLTLSGNLYLPDNKYLNIGDGNDLTLYHDGSDSHIKDQGTGDLYISAGDDLVLRTNGGAKTALIANDDGSVELYHDSNKKLETNSGGCTITGVLVPSAADGGALGTANYEWSDLYLADGGRVYFGNDQDVMLTHNPDVGLALNNGSTIYRSDVGQYDAAFTVREGQAGKAHFEFGHSNTSGYGSTIGCENGGGGAFLAFNCGPGTANNTYETHGIQGMVLKSASYSGAAELRLCHIPTATADDQSPVTKFTFYSSGNLNVSGALSKGSGSFRIPHPLNTKKDTHDLVHSFIEGPQADLIYRGRATLVAGEVSVDIDGAAGMTSGTFEALCRDVQCFTSNENGWTAVRGSVSGSTLTIEAQDADCTDTISWMVVGERKDQHMFDTDWTDENGRVIVEPEKRLEQENGDLVD